uniref:B-cell receptor CD22 n=1 Tax=Sparus aurata TaxID=8175 RepID=A0A671TGU7_SPAAU
MRHANQCERTSLSSCLTVGFNHTYFLSNGLYTDLRTDPEYSGRVQYNFGNNDCTLRITDLRESDSAEYKFRFTTNEPGGGYTGSPGVTLSVTVSPSAEIVEGSSVTLTCSSDANPAAIYTWYKENRNADLQPLSKERQLHFSSIQSSDSGEYYCTAENELWMRMLNMFISPPDAPRLPSVSVSPSAEIVEGSSVTLTCSSDANPAANYTWYKENEDSPKASGQIFTITDFRSEHRGNYSCESQNRRGRNKTTVHLTVVSGTFLMVLEMIKLVISLENSVKHGMVVLTQTRLLVHYFSTKSHVVKSCTTTCPQPDR